MAVDPPLNNPPKTLPSPDQLEKKSKRNSRLTKVLTTLTALITLGATTLGICASLALIPWSIAGVAMVIAFVLVVLCLIKLKKIEEKQSLIKGLFPLPKKSSDIFFRKLFSTFLSEDSKRIFLPSEDISSLNPDTWFSNQRLLEAFTKEWTFFADNDDHFVYKHVSNNNISLILQRGDIATLHVTNPAPGTVSAIVNAAKAEMARGGGGTNCALTQAVTEESWNLSKEGRETLKVSEVSAGKWISQNPVKAGETEPNFLIQALGPKASDYPNTFEAYEALIVAYVNCFEKARSLGVTVLQLPIISSHHFATYDRGWPVMTHLAFLAGLSLFLEQNPDSSIKNIILINLNEIPNFN